MTAANGSNARAAREVADEGRFGSVVESLCAQNEPLLSGARRKRGPHALPSRDVIEKVVDDLRAALFPGHFGSCDLAPTSVHFYVGARLDDAQRGLLGQVRRGFGIVCDHDRADESDCGTCGRRAADVTEALVSSLPRLRGLLETDVQAAFDGDPAAKFVDETLFCYPGVAAIIQHRIAHELYRLEVPLLPRIVSELAHAATGIDIHPGAEIGPSFFIDHGTGVVIGETCLIGEHVRIYQGVTLGARGFPANDAGQLLKGLLRHPVVEDHVVIYAGATILGRITIGRGATIGGNVWLTRNVDPGAHVSQAQARHDTFEAGSGI